MRSLMKKLALPVVGLTGVLLLLLGAATGNWLASAGGVLLLFGVVVGARRWVAARRARKNEDEGAYAASVDAANRFRDCDDGVPRRSSTPSGDLVEDMIAQNRYALLLRPQIAANLSSDQSEAAREAMEEDMALVPEGDVFLCQPDDREEQERPLQTGGRVLRVEPALIDRYPVTNYQFKQFVDAGGYEEMALWDGEIWPGVFGFVDATGHPGPRFWEQGNYAKGLANHPVVGVCWYEANAYARWVGKRLPTDAEWVKTGCWPMPVQRGLPSQRRFPWGDAWEPERANIWSTDVGGTCPVTAFEEGGSVAGVYGLIGNVWEWTADPFGLWHGEKVQGSDNFKSLRGGAFDTYFESQATCQFQSGDSPLVRKRNIGFRCALGLCDLQPTPDAGEIPAEHELVYEEV